MNIILNEVLTVRRAFLNFKNYGTQAAQDYFSDTNFTSSDIELTLSLGNFKFKNLTHSEGEFITSTRALDVDTCGDIIVPVFYDVYFYELHCSFMNDDFNLEMILAAPTLINITAVIKLCGVTRFNMNNYDNNKFSFDGTAYFDTFSTKVFNIDFDTKNHMHAKLTNIHSSLSSS